MCGNALLVTDNYILSSLGIFLNVTQWVQIFSEGVFFFITRRIASSNTYRLEAHAGFFRLLMKGMFDPYAL